MTPTEAYAAVMAVVGYVIGLATGWLFGYYLGSKR